jgi:hypothetical protein
VIVRRLVGNAELDHWIIGEWRRSKDVTGGTKRRDNAREGFLRRDVRASSGPNATRG